jgi:hypothetical protein
MKHNIKEERRSLDAIPTQPSNIGPTARAPAGYQIKAGQSTNFSSLSGNGNNEILLLSNGLKLHKLLCSNS